MLVHREAGGFFEDMAGAIVSIFTGGGGGGSGGSSEAEAPPETEAPADEGGCVFDWGDPSTYWNCDGQADDKDNEGDQMPAEYNPNMDPDFMGGDAIAIWAELEAAGCHGATSLAELKECYQAAVDSGLVLQQAGGGGPGTYHVDNLMNACAAGGATSCTAILRMALGFADPQCEAESIESWNSNIACDCEAVAPNGTVGMCWEREALTLQEKIDQQMARLQDITPPQEGGIGSQPGEGTPEEEKKPMWPWVVGGAGALWLVWYATRPR